MRFLLINPPIRESGPPKHYPYGLCLLAGVLDQYGYEVAILDANAYRLNREQVRVEAKELLAVPGAGPESKTWDCIGIGSLITTYCYSADTRVLTKDGLRLFSELTFEDELLTINLKTRQLEYQCPSELAAFDYDGDLIHFAGRRYDFLVTPNHRMVAKARWEEDFTLIDAIELASKSTPATKLANYQFLKGGAVWRCQALESMKLPPTRRTDGRRDSPQKIIPINLWLRFLGWWLSEGSLGIRRWPGKRSLYEVRISNQNPDYLQEITATIRQMGFNPLLNRGAGYLYFYSKQVVDYLRPLGHAHDKYVPKDLKQLPPEQLKMLMNSLMKGDGWADKQYTTVSKRLADDVAEIAIKLGRAVTITKANHYFKIGFSNYNEPAIDSEPCHVRYKGRVFCATVPNHTLMVERNGKLAWSGNSWQKDVIKGIRSDFPNTPLIAGGGCATALGAQMLEWIPELDAVVIGEAEKTILEIAKQECNFNGIKGVTWRDRETGKINFNPPVELMTEEEFDQLPYPAWNLAPLEEVYFPNSSVALSKESLLAKRRLDFECTRGCPYICNFCTDVMTGDSRTGYQYSLKFRKHSPKYVAGMIAKARFKLSIDFGLFIDENFDVDRKWVFALCDALEDADLVGLVYWGATAHVNTVSPDLLARMRQCGCAYLDFGMESGSDPILRYIKKNATRQRNQQALDWSLRTGVNPLTNFMMGQPIETVQTVYDTAQFIAKNGIIVKPFFATPYPATELYYTQMEKILGKYGELEKFILALGDATDLAVNLTRFNDAELFGLRELVARHDLNGLLDFAKIKGEQIMDPDTKLELVSGQVLQPEPPVPIGELKMLEDKDYGMRQSWIEELRAKHLQAGWVVNPPQKRTD